MDPFWCMSILHLRFQKPSKIPGSSFFIHCPSNAITLTLTDFIYNSIMLNLIQINSCVKLKEEKKVYLISISVEQCIFYSSNKSQRDIIKRTGKECRLIHTGSFNILINIWFACSFFFVSAIAYIIKNNESILVLFSFLYTKKKKRFLVLQLTYRWE